MSFHEGENSLWAHTGLKLELSASPWEDRYNLMISDLNPQQEIKWALSRRELLQIGWWFIRKAIRVPS